jgi:hypothetical protein
MTERIVDFLDALVATVGAIDERYCLVEKREMPYNDETTNIPYKYVGNGNYRPVEVDGGSVSYWRLVNNISFDVIDGNSAIKNLQATYPIRYVAMVKRDANNPLVFSQDVANVLEGRNKDLQTQLQAKNVNITVNSIDTNTPNIWSEEFTMPLKEPDYKRSLVMIDITVTVIAKRECWQDCDNYPDILQGFPWCEDTAATVDRLTIEQRQCLSDELCGNPLPATVQLNGVTVGTIQSGDTNSFTVNLDGTPSGTWDGTEWQVTSSPCADATVQLNGVDMTDIPSGDTENILVLQSDDMTQVGSKQGTHWRIDDSAISINGSPVADVAAEDSLDIDVIQDGLPVGSWNGTEWVVPSCATPPPSTITKAISFDGVNDYAVTGLPKINLANFSVSFRFKLNSTAGRTSLYSFASVNTSGQTAQEMYYGSNAFVFLSRDVYSFSQTLPWTGDTNWHVFTMRYNSTVRSVEIFIDGVSLGVCSQQVLYTNPLWSLVLGRAFILSEYGNVKMTDIRVFNHYLTTGEITTLQTPASPVGNEVVWYPFGVESIGDTDFATDIITGYQLAMYNITSPNGIVAYP